MDTSSAPFPHPTQMDDGIPVALDDEEPTVAIKNETIEEIGLEEQRKRHLREEAERMLYEANLQLCEGLLG
jgi:Tat protein secretion system quality control protein TatD with DNase activity